jgi:hypothetical protein
LGERFSEGLARGMLVESLRFKADGAKGHEDEEQPLEIAKGRDGGIKHPPKIPHVAQRVGAPEREDEEESVHDLEEL